MRIEFTVHGTPQPQGSTKAFTPKGWTRAVITTDNKRLKPWRQDISALAQEQMKATNQAMALGPVRLTVTFWFAKPKSTPKAVVWKITRPDLDKIVRGVGDSLTGIAFKDDCQIVESHSFKSFAQAEGARITVESL